MWFYKLARAFLWVLCQVLFRIRVVGIENLPEGKGFILASNHRTNFDPMFLATRIHPALMFMAKAELFCTPLRGLLFRALKAFPVERGKGDMSAVDFAMQTIAEGRVLAMFPEGTRSPDGNLIRLKSGCTVIAAGAGADVVPVAICYGERLRFRCHVTVRFGKPIPAAELGVTPGKPSTIKAGNRLLTERISQLLGEGL